MIDPLYIPGPRTDLPDGCTAREIDGEGFGGDLGRDENEEESA